MNDSEFLCVSEPGRLPSPECLLEIATELGQDIDHWGGRLASGFEERACVSLFLQAHLRIWAIAWDDADDAGFLYHHDHCSSGGVYVVRGVLRQERIRLGRPPAGRRVPAGEGFCFDETAVLRMRPERGAGPTVSVHAYSPLLEFTGKYGEREEGLLRRLPASSKERLSMRGWQGTSVARAGTTKKTANGHPDSDRPLETR